MWWYCGSIVIDDNGCPQIEHKVECTKLLSRIYQLKEEQVKKLSSFDSSTSNIYRDEFELSVERSLILYKYENYDVAFAVLVERLCGYGCLEKVKESVSGLLFKESAFMHT